MFTHKNLKNLNPNTYCSHIVQKNKEGVISTDNFLNVYFDRQVSIVEIFIISFGSVLNKFKNPHICVAIGSGFWSGSGFSTGSDPNPVNAIKSDTKHSDLYLVANVKFRFGKGFQLTTTELRLIGELPI